MRGWGDPTRGRRRSLAPKSHLLLNCQSVPRALIPTGLTHPQGWDREDTVLVPNQASMPTLPGHSFCVGELGPTPLDSSNLSLLPHLGPNLDSLGIIEDVEAGSLRPVHPSLSLSRREVPGQPPNGLLPLSGLHPSLPPPSPGGVQTVTVTLAETQPHTQLEP